MLALTHALLCHAWQAAHVRCSDKALALSADGHTGLSLDLQLACRKQQTARQMAAAHAADIVLAEADPQADSSKCEADDGLLNNKSADLTKVVLFNQAPHQQGEQQLGQTSQTGKPTADSHSRLHEMASDQQLGNPCCPSGSHLHQHGHQLGHPHSPEDQPKLARNSFSDCIRGRAHQRLVQTIHIKLIVCAISLQAMPFVAWLKQPMPPREWAGWQDALACAVVALHATLYRHLVRCCTFYCDKLQGLKNDPLPAKCLNC